MNQLLNYCERELPWLLETVRALVEIESPTPDKAAIDRCGDELVRHLTAQGGRVTRIPNATAGDHILAEFGDGSPFVLVLGHIDTVWDIGTLAKRPIRESEGKLYGPGVFDMKAGIGLGLLAVRALAGSPGGLPGRIVMLMTSDEEVGSPTSRTLIEDQARGSKAVLVLEPSLKDGALKTSRKGCGEYTLRVTGVAAHAGIEPQKGANAIHELARLIPQIESLQDLEVGTTLNVDVVRGGSRTNVIAAEAEAAVDVRVPDHAEFLRVDAAINGLRVHDPRTNLVVVRRTGFRPPFERKPAVAELFRQAQSVAAELGHALGEGSTGGGSDGNFTAALDIPTLDGLGAVGMGAHHVDEQVDIADLPWRAALVAGLLRRILA